MVGMSIDRDSVDPARIPLEEVREALAALLSYQNLALLRQLDYDGVEYRVVHRPE